MLKSAKFPFAVLRGAGSRARRLALVRPALVVPAMGIGLVGGAYFASAQTSPAPVAMTSALSGTDANLADIPALMAAYGQRQAAKARATSARSGAVSVQGGELAGPGLVEVDLTPNSPSDEREPVFSPGGDYIAFVSNGADKNGDGKIDSLNSDGNYHVWIMNRDGSSQRQVTGLYADKSRAQRRPTFSPDGNLLAYIDSSAPVSGGGNAQQVFVAQPFVDRDNNISNGIQVPPAEQRTFVRGNKNSPAWSPTGLAITFACDANIDNDPNGGATQYDLFSISPDGATSSLVRLTGGTNDPIGRTTNDQNAVYSVVNPAVIYFSSNRDATGKLPKGRRIWAVNSSGNNRQVISDPLARGGRADDFDDMPSPSVAVDSFAGQFDERIVFQSNSPTDASDTSVDGADRNIWSLLVDSNTLAGADAAANQPHLVISNYANDTAVTINPFTGLQQDELGSGVNGPEGLTINGRIVYVSNSIRNRIEAYNIDTGTSPRPDPTFAQGGGLVSPAGLCHDGTYLYVAAKGTGTKAIYRYRLSNGAPFASAGGAAGSAEFSHSDNSGITNGYEGISFGPDISGDGKPDLYVSAFLANKINAFDGVTGKWLRVFADSTLGISTPTGITYDSVNDELYVANAGTNQVRVFVKSGEPGLEVGALRTDFWTIGVGAGLDRPEGAVLADLNNDGDLELYVSNYGNGFGNSISRFDAATGDLVDGDGSHTWLTSPVLVGPGYFDFDDVARLGPPAPTPAPTPGSAPALETSSAPATLVTNYLSSPNRFAASKLTGANAFEDKCADYEPAFGRDTSVPELYTAIAFASARRFAPSPSTNLSNPTPVMYNPAGGKEFTETGAVLTPVRTSDIWVTAALDTTPPALVPQGAGNSLYPVMAPGSQAPFSAPRTFEQGLAPNSNLKVAVVISEQGSGLSLNPAQKAVTVTLSDAGRPRFDTGTTIVNESARATYATEIAPREVVNFIDIPLQPYDDGACVADGSGGCLADSPNPANRRGGHERQAGAIAGDGIYYCESDPVKAPLKTPPTSGEFYIDINVTDVQGNSFTFDKIWGFATTPFTKSVGNDLFVSDYTVGQQFPFLLKGDARFANMVPVESYYLNSPGGEVLNAATPPAVIARAQAVTFPNVDVWRVLCRGGVTQDILNSYQPRIAQQIDPKETGVTPPFTKLSRSVAVSEKCVIWAAPYVGTAFSGPGTLYDSAIQTRLTTFLNNGGRLFVSGREIIFSLSNQGSTSNTFLESELRAKFGGEGSALGVTATTNNFTLDPQDALYNSPQFPLRPNGDLTATYLDASLSQNPGSVANQFDLITAVASAAGITVTPAYTHNGTPVGQSVRRIRSSGLESRVVFFSFNLDAVNRRYTALYGYRNVRSRIADNIRRYFKTASISGKVINDATNLPVSNFLVKATGAGDVFYARTDANGNYQFDGLPTELPSAGYSVTPVYDPAVTPNSGFYGGTSTGASLSGGDKATNLNFRVIVRPPGSLSGYAVTSNGTPGDLTDDQPLPNATVLVRSVNNSSIFTGGGKFAKLGKTNAAGFYSLDSIPANIPLEVVFNPTVEDIPAESGLRAGYTASGGQSKNFGRRLVPDKKRPDAASGGSDIMVPDGDNYVLDDGTADNVADNGRPVVVPYGPWITGKVYVGSTVITGATVTLTKVSVAGSAPVPAPVVTDSTGMYFFEDVAPGTWKASSTVTYRGGTFSGSRNITVTQGNNISAQHINIFTPKIKGTVKNTSNQVVSGASIAFRNADGSAPAITRAGTTNASGYYELWDIPAGTWQVVATKGAASGTAQVTVTATADANAPVIIVTNNQLSGKVFLNGNPLAGATVELLNGSGASFSPARTAATGADGAYSFANSAGGTFQVKASYNGATAQAGPFTVAAGAATAPNLNLYFQKVTGRVVKGDNTVASGATVQLLDSNGSVVATATADAVGAYSFSNVGTGTYTIRASLGNTSGQTSATVTGGKDTVATTIVLEAGGSGVTTFDVIGRTYAVSVPWEDTNSPTTNNKGDTVGSSYTPASTVLERAFNLPLTDAQKQTNYVLQRFDAAARQWVVLPAGGTIKRGEGYLLKVVKRPVSLVTPSADSTRVPLDYSQSSGKTFTFVLRYAASITSDPNNGLNLIGFPFDPAKVSQVDWSSATVTWPGAPATGPDGKPWTVATAAATGKMSATLSTIDPSNGNGATSSVLKPFLAYYTMAKVDNLQVTVTAK